MSAGPPVETVAFEACDDRRDRARYWGPGARRLDGAASWSGVASSTAMAWHHEVSSLASRMSTPEGID
jgi:hypothetical protein